MKPASRAVDLLIALAIVSVIPALAAVMANLLRPATTAIDPWQSFGWISVHHILQLALTVLMLKIRFNKPLSEWGFNQRERHVSVQIFAWFCLIYLVPVFFVNVLPSLRSGIPPRFDYPLTPGTIAGTLGFQFLLSGTCEEPLFRGFVMTFLGRSWEGTTRVGKVVFPITGLWATLLFMIAHVNISLAPFSITTSVWQQMWALGLGLYYAAAFARTGSLLAPALSHGYSNGVIFLVLYVLVAVMS